MGLVDTVSIPTLLKMAASGRIPAEKMGTHSFTFAQMDEAYDVFENAAENSALKVVIPSRLIPACHKSFVSFGCCNDQN
jgi:alcohol dehydrogenase